ncbi:uncharacterized protein METZ01_LOCUS512921, partial [marine metagenome]
MPATNDNQDHLSLLREKLGGGQIRTAQMLISSLHPAEIARLLESLPQTERTLIWKMVDPDISGEVLVELADEVRDRLIESMNTDEVVAALDGMQLDDL